MKELTIATFNFRNTFAFYQTLKEKSDCFTFVKFIMENNIDILGTQETTIRKLRTCLPLLTEYGYKIYGDGRLGKIGLFFPFSLTNETNAIIFKDDMSERGETLKLPWLGSQFPRIVTKGVFGNVVFLNTHLDYVNNKVKKKQLETIYYLINDLVKMGKKIILTGDFNMTLRSKDLKKFINDLKILGIKRVPVNIMTCKGVKSGAIDHVFIPNKWEIKEVLLPELSISDHKPIVVKVRINEEDLWEN